MIKELRTTGKANRFPRFFPWFPIYKEKAMGTPLSIYNGKSPENEVAGKANTRKLTESRNCLLFI